MERQGVAVPPVELKDKELPAIVESGEHQQSENHEETPCSLAPRPQIPSPTQPSTPGNCHVLSSITWPQSRVLPQKSAQELKKPAERTPHILFTKANCASCQLPGPFSSLDSSIETLKKKAQELIENINESRQKDHALMTNFRDSLKMKVSDLTEKLEERMYQVYSHHSKIIQERLQEFTQKMAKISHLEMELKQVCQTVETVYKDLCVQSEVPTSEEQNYKDGEY